MNHKTTRTPGRRSRRAGRMLAAAAVVVVGLFVTAGPAFALNPPNEMTCNYDQQPQSFNACFSVSDLGGGFWAVHVGLDVLMPHQYAQDLVDCGNTFSALLMGRDGDWDPIITAMYTSPGWPGAGDDRIAVEFDTVLQSGDLNVDHDDGLDGVYARINLYDCHNHTNQVFYTNVVSWFF